ncbi:MAG: S-methyl-5-thioribose-1-phosphate isomerase [Ignavibacteria bacterium]|nr:S-methyl-5-thioribose-1-phosphate isomerase [Ignavibacteria bacterium]
MKINGKHYHTIWETDDIPTSISIIDQRSLPHKFEIVELRTLNDFIFAINEMLVRGAPLIGVTALYGLFFSVKDCTEENFEFIFNNSVNQILSTRPTAVNLKNALEVSINEISKTTSLKEKLYSLLQSARSLKEKEIFISKKIGEYGVQLIEEVYQKKKRVVNILTHCNAGWLATIDYGTALAPIYFANERGIPLHVWVDETRPRLQGAKLTAFELLHEGIPHTIVTDNSGGLLMQKGLVDIVIVGTDRTTRKGDVANKIGTYLKALAAYDNGIPFYVALPSTSIDWGIENALEEIPIEIRDEKEVKYVSGKFGDNVVDILICPENSQALNHAFDITPSRLVTGFITERGLCSATEEGLLSLFPEMK